MAIPARKLPIHLSEMLAIVLRYDADQKHALKTEADKLVPGLLRKSGALTPEQLQLLDDALATGQTLDAIRTDRSYLTDADEGVVDAFRSVAKLMFKVLGGLAAGLPAQDARTWSSRKWAKVLKWKLSEIPEPAAVVRSFDLQQLAAPIVKCRRQAKNEILTERGEAAPDELPRESIWKYAAQKVNHLATIDISPHELERCIARIALNAHPESTPISRHLAPLQIEGFTEILIGKLWEEYPEESEAAGLPLPIPEQRNGIGGRQFGRRKRKRGRGRPAEYDEKLDKRISDAWSTGHYKRYRDLASKMRIEEWEVKTATDRVRHPKKNTGATE